ncbi:uncharacterized protein LOC8056570 [Sorghum bicolor]|jgi:hypothetical protein|uniref:Rx N-terminal domain-containing protein n=1 Tax=Sorghum bicolor TaxID=4558 RepID=A0A1B6Q1Q4_SORBI|nr:uncharacterized protein LOC8056570 [Sorghum bicolor]KXG31795.1 hypothetical protein SORBI_3003G057500 [Sorghum bicolor]|eukprot:XP_021311259.1 uncharacterized protein LOC8056570 [Sorghum bicolor]
MEILESALLGEFIRYIKSNWSAHSRVDQRRRRLRQLVSKVRAVVDAAEGGAGAAVRDESFSAWLQVLRSEAVRGQEVLDDVARATAVASSARRFLAGFKALFVCSAEVDRLEGAVDQLELLAGPGGDLDMFVRVLSLDAARPAATEEDMDVDGGRPPAPGARHQQEGSGCSCGCAGTVAPLLASPGAKRKRACGGGGGSGVDSGSTSRGEVDAVQPQKRRHLAWMRSHQGLPSASGRVSSAPREPPPAVLSRSRRARTVALAMSRIRRRIGKPTTTSHRREPSLGRQFSRITL